MRLLSLNDCFMFECFLSMFNVWSVHRKHVLIHIGVLCCERTTERRDSWSLVTSIRRSHTSWYESVEDGVPTGRQTCRRTGVSETKYATNANRTPSWENLSGIRNSLRASPLMVEYDPLASTIVSVSDTTMSTISVRHHLCFTWILLFLWNGLWIPCHFIACTACSGATMFSHCLSRWPSRAHIVHPHGEPCWP